MAGCLGLKAEMMQRKPTNVELHEETYTGMAKRQDLESVQCEQFDDGDASILM
jgi:hypothetical protein